MDLGVLGGKLQSTREARRDASESVSALLAELVGQGNLTQVQADLITVRIRDAESDAATLRRIVSLLLQIVEHVIDGQFDEARTVARQAQAIVLEWGTYDP